MYPCIHGYACIHACLHTMYVQVEQMPSHIQDYYYPPQLQRPSGPPGASSTRSSQAAGEGVRNNKVRYSPTEFLP